MDLCDWVNLCLLLSSKLLEHTQVPNAQFTFVITRSKEVSGLLSTVPRDDIDVAITGDPRHNGLELSCTQVPKFNRGVRGTRSEDVVLGW